MLLIIFCYLYIIVILHWKCKKWIIFGIYLQLFFHFGHFTFHGPFLAFLQFWYWVFSGLRMNKCVINLLYNIKIRSVFINELTALVNLSIADRAFIKSSSFFFSCSLSRSLSDLWDEHTEKKTTIEYRKFVKLLMNLPWSLIQCFVVDDLTILASIISWALLGSSRACWAQTRSWRSLATTLQICRKK